MKLINSKEARSLLLSGEVVAIPTETVYGLAGWIYSDAGLKKIFSTKERPFFDPLIVHIDTKEKAILLTSEWTEAHDVLADACWPGPLTLIALKNEKVSSLITSGLNSVGLRCPRHEETLKLLSTIDGGLAAPSANKFGKTSPTNSQHVFEEFGNSVSILEGGNSEIGIESTVVGLEKNGSSYVVKIYRPGFYTPPMLESILKQKGIQATVEYTESPVAPGQLKHHYMPRIPLVIIPNDSSWGMIKASIESKLKKNFLNPILWKLPHDPAIASRILYQDLRSFDQNGHDLILISREPHQHSDSWFGIWNRLEKAQSLTL